jgi:hypothetical protein
MRELVGWSPGDCAEGHIVDACVGGHTGFIALAVFLQLAHKVLVVALPALAVLQVVLLEFGRESLEELAFGRGYAGG